MALSVISSTEEVPFAEFRRDENESKQESKLAVETEKSVAIGLNKPIEEEIQWNVEDILFSKRKIEYCFKKPPHPWLPPNVQKKIERIKKSQLRNKEWVSLFGEIAQISTDFYDLREGKVVAIKMDGRIAESAESESKLLFKIQGKTFDTPVFVWKVGSSSFAGWKK